MQDRLLYTSKVRISASPQELKKKEDRLNPKMGLCCRFSWENVCDLCFMYLLKN